MTLSAATTICNRSPKAKEGERSEIQQQIAEYQAKGGQIHQSEAGRVRYVPIRFAIKQR